MTSSVTELRHGWPVVLACFATAVHAWGFGFYGLSVYVARLQLERGWSTSFVAGATLAFYLFGALLLANVPMLLQRWGPRVVLLGGSCCMTGGAILAGHATTRWQLLAGFLVMGVGWAGTSVVAIVATLALWFDRQRGLAISLALNGASIAGVTTAPALVMMADAWGLGVAATWMAIGGLVVVVPLILLGTACARPAAPDASSRAVAAADPRPGLSSKRAALASLRFWSVAGPFRLVIMAQVGLVVHLVSILLPSLGSAGAGLGMGLVAGCAVLGRVGLGLVIDRLDQRRAAAMGFAVQVAGILLILAWPTMPWAMYGGCVLYGLAVGNNITLPSLIVQREFTAASFGVVIGLSTALGQAAYAFAPALLGLLHDAGGGYATVLAVCAAFTAAGAVGLVAGAPRKA